MFVGAGFFPQCALAYSQRQISHKKTKMDGILLLLILMFKILQVKNVLPSVDFFYCGNNITLIYWVFKYMSFSFSD